MKTIKLIITKCICGGNVRKHYERLGCCDDCGRVYVRVVNCKSLAYDDELFGYYEVPVYKWQSTMFKNEVI